MVRFVQFRLLSSEIEKKVIKRMLKTVRRGRKTVWSRKLVLLIL